MKEHLFISAAAVLALFVYHARLFYLLKRHPDRTSIGLSNHMRTLWVERIMTEHKDVLAVQTLRNLTMAATFLASTAIMIDLWLMNAILGDPSRENTLAILQAPGFGADKLWIYQLILLTITFMFCFANFMLSVRYYNLVAIFINVSLSKRNFRYLQRPGFFIDMSRLPKVDNGVLLVAETFNRGAAHYTLGMRGYYLVLPFSLWLFGEWWFLFGTLLMLLVLRRVDSAE
ncbi:MAG: DUF599 domain-containing protein [Magnetococcales bacterium]|nr:DUF599 domain-containing protein [Magnetococcales bacterium]